MEVIRHERECQNPQWHFRKRIRQRGQKHFVVRVLRENPLSAIPSIQNVIRQTVNEPTCAS
jgi:hypothetical protein